MNERVKELRDFLGLTMEKFGERVGVKKSAINKIEKGNNSVTDQMIKSICREFGVSEEWLRTGDGDMFLPADRNTDIAKLTKQLLNEESDSFKNRFVSMLANLTIEEWKFLERKAKELCEMSNEKDNSD